MNILVIGGTAFLGYSITWKLLEKGHSVTLFNRGQHIDDFGDRVNRIHGDRQNRSSFLKIMEGKTFDAIVDMIAISKEDGQSSVNAFLGNTGHFIHISSAAVYLVTKDFSSPLKEEDFDRPLFIPKKIPGALWEYGRRKRGCEDVLKKAHLGDRFPVTFIRPPIIFGERDYTLRAYSYFIRIGDGKPLLLPDGGRMPFSLAYQGDLAQAVTDMLHNPVTFGQAYNLAQKSAFTVKNFVQKAAEIMGKNPQLIDIPSTLLKRTSLKTAFSPYSNRRSFVLDIGKAQKELNYSPDLTDRPLRNTIQWFFKNYDGPPPDNYLFREKEVALAEKYGKSEQ